MQKTEANTPSPPRLISPLLWTFLISMILANVGGQMYYPLLPLYLKELDAGVEEIGIFFTLSMIIPLALQIAGGWISDHIGRLKAIAIGSLGGTVGWIGTLLAPDWRWLLVSQSVGSIAMSFVSPSFDAFIAEQADERNRAKVFAVSQSIYQVVAVIGPLAGGFVVRALGWRGLIWAAAILYFSATAVRLSMARRAKSPPHAARLSARSFGSSFKAMVGMSLAGGLITWLILSDGVRDIAVGLSTNLLPLFLQEERGVDVTTIGLFNALFGGAGMLAMIPSGHLSDRLGERYAIGGGFLLAFLSFCLLLLSHSPWAAGISFVLFGAAMGLLQPAYQSLISKAVPERLRGIAFGFLSTSNGFVALPAPWLGSILWRGVAPAAPFWVTSLSMLLLAPIVLAKLRLPAGPIPGETGESPSA